MIGVMLPLAWPSLILAIIQSSLAVVDASLASHLGINFLAAVSVIYPIFMLMQTVSLGGYGGAVASHIARAAGAKNPSLVRETAYVALGLSFCIGLSCSIAFITFGPSLLARFVATSEVAGLAWKYGLLLIGAAPLFWVGNCTISIARGLGQTRLTLNVAGAAYVLQALAVSACILFFGLKSITILAVASILASCLISVLITLKISKLPVFKAGASHRPPRWKKTLMSIFSMGAFTSASSMMTGLSLIFLSLTAARFGTDALSAYGLVVRLEVIMMLITTSVGVAVVTTCASSLGRMDVHRAIGAAKIGVALTTAIVGTVGILIALSPDNFLRPFSATSGVRESAILYLSIVGWAFPSMATGFASFFVGQGINRPKLFFGAAAFRLVYLIAAVHLAVASFESFSIVVASGYCVFGLLAAMALVYESRKLKMKANEVHP